eukprot:TRINITY_DN5002_c0_g1_i1.p1 TRINITY_DN5002_c0_g1~~TRINITY_DN5002_c0_g1_i1.p1  ORF type:complete len:215 (-),score=58.97 TRINITY_DN5002_c0_g1_i1:85-729(-)
MSTPFVIDIVTVYSLFSVVVILFLAYLSSKYLLPKEASKGDRLTFIWLAFDALIHFLLEGSFLFHSLFTSQNGKWGANYSNHFTAKLWQEYAKADFRWGVGDPNIVSVELLTVLGAGPLCVLILWQIIRQDAMRHYWIVVLCTAEIYGGFMTFSPEWLTGSLNLDTSNFMFHYVYLYFFNGLWVAIPLVLMWDSYRFIARRMRSSNPNSHQKKH